MRSQVMPMVLVSGIAGFVVAGCATVGPNWVGFPNHIRAKSGASSSCADVLLTSHRAIANAGTSDVEAARIPGFPYLRINRFLAHLGTRFSHHHSGPGFQAWVDELRALDVQSTRIEIANMATVKRVGLAKELLVEDRTANGVFERVDQCAQTLRVADLAHSSRRRLLLERAVVPDSYSGLARVAGVYPLTAIPVLQGWDRWRRVNLQSFDHPAEALPVAGQVLEFTPREFKGVLRPDRVRRIVARSRAPVLGIPQPKGRDLAQLFAAFAPVWRVDVSGPYDRIGTPTWQGQSGGVKIDIRRPTVFTRVEHTVVDEQVLLQLVYAVWFQKRPLEGPFDLLGGQLDSVIWRVTLGPDGRPIMYDSIHACGCYHLFFPLSRFRDRRAHGGTGYLNETPAVIRSVPEPVSGERLVLSITSASHYIANVSTARVDRRAPPGQETYRLADDTALRSLARPKHGRRSLFGQDGLVAGSERLERYVLWPMGIASTGAMRQWGHHATAFVGRRHFDDPRLFDKIFPQ